MLPLLLHPATCPVLTPPHHPHHHAHPPQSTEYSFGPGWLSWEAEDWADGGSVLTRVRGTAARGSSVLGMASAAGIQVGGRGGIGGGAGGNIFK